jgi:hypothetical protein
MTSSPINHHAERVRYKINASVVTRTLILAFVPIFILFIGGAPPAVAKDPDAWLVKGRLFGKDGKKSTDISGIACSTAEGFPRSCLIIDDNLQSAQFVIVHNRKLIAGDLVRLISSKYKGKLLELDGEGVAYADGYYYVMGSHGYPRDREHKLDPITDKIRARIAASSQIVRVTAHADAPTIMATGKLRAIIAANPVLSPFLDRRLEMNGLTIEGVAVKGGRLFAGFRAPSLDNGRAAVLSVRLGALYGPSRCETLPVAARRRSGRARPYGLCKWLSCARRTCCGRRRHLRGLLVGRGK